VCEGELVEQQQFSGLQVDVDVGVVDAKAVVCEERELGGQAVELQSAEEAVLGLTLGRIGGRSAAAASTMRARLPST
jgi:hypothetical protein